MGLCFLGVHPFLVVVKGSHLVVVKGSHLVVLKGSQKEHLNTVLPGFFLGERGGGGWFGPHLHLHILV